MSPPSPPPPDPLAIEQEKQAKVDQLNALQETLKGDTASIMARFGVMQALSGKAASAPLSQAKL